MAGVLVTGGSGFIGSQVVAALAVAGHRVRVLDRAPPRAVPEGVEVVLGDVRDRGACEAALAGVDAVSHHAATVGMGVDLQDLPHYVSVNDLGTAVLLAAMHAAGVRRLVLATSMVVYGEGAYGCERHGPVRPAARREPTRTLRDGVGGGRFDPPARRGQVARDPARPGRAAGRRGPGRCRRGRCGREGRAVPPLVAGCGRRRCRGGAAGDGGSHRPVVAPGVGAGRADRVRAAGCTRQQDRWLGAGAAGRHRPGWRLLVRGPAGEGSLADLQTMPQVRARLPIACVEGWSAQGNWEGVRVRDVAGLVGAPVGADVRFVSLQRGGSYGTSVLPAAHVRDELSLLALRLNGGPLELDHGYPCRLIAASRPGVLQTKWLIRIEVLA